MFLSTVSDSVRPECAVSLDFNIFSPDFDVKYVSYAYKFCAA